MVVSLFSPDFESSQLKPANFRGSFYPKATSPTKLAFSLEQNHSFVKLPLRAGLTTTRLSLGTGVLFAISSVSELVPESHWRILFPRATSLPLIVWCLLPFPPPCAEAA